MNPSGRNTHSTLFLISVAILIAVAGTAAMFLIEFRPNHDVAGTGISMITAASAGRAGAIAHPTEPVAR